MKAKASINYRDEYISASLVGRENWYDVGWVVGCVLPVPIVTLAVCLVSLVVHLE